MISSLTEQGSETTLRALELGAVDFIAKPRAETPAALHRYTEEVCEKIRAAKTAQPQRAQASLTRQPASPTTGVSGRTLSERIIAIGASTGGTEAIKDVLASLPATMPGIVMVQHMPETFTPSFARRLGGLCALKVLEAQGGERIMPGHAYLAPGHSHLLVKKRGDGWVTELSKAEPVNRHRPAVDVLFDSVAREVGRNAIGVILTGMGKDGAQGMLAMKKAGAWNIGQDQGSCVVYGMPREAALVGALDEVVSLGSIGERLLARLRL